ncbi:MAG: methyltransferase domain-containing protein, partial [Kiloniellales bacterium]|nr:methyltransferase domain-containing protein [Kiloniellales bacterium]
FARASARGSLLPFALLFTAANILSFMVIPVLGMANTVALGIAAFLVILSAGLFGAILPLMSELAAKAGRNTGKKVSEIYAANIAGAALGSILTGLVFLDIWSLRTVAQVLALGGGLLAIFLLLRSDNPARAAVPAIFVGTVTALMIAVLAPPAFEGIYERLQFKGAAAKYPKFEAIAEGRNGVVAITETGVVYGTGVYDGRVTINLMEDYNALYRPTAVAALHDAPSEVLVIGLSTGAWTQILANLPGVERITAIEINPGYIELMPRYEKIASLLTNPKIEIVIDDGRRWLRRNPHAKFDFIVANTTFHWRAGAGRLLSKEYLEIIQGHLKPGGAYVFNTTQSPEVYKTAAQVFPHALRLAHFLFVSDRPLVLDKTKWRRALENLRVDGVLLLDKEIPRERQKIEEIVSLADRIGPPGAHDTEFAVEGRDSILERTQANEIVTDDNMITEWPRFVDGRYEF